MRLILLQLLAMPMQVTNFFSTDGYRDWWTLSPTSFTYEITMISKWSSSSLQRPCVNSSRIYSQTCTRFLLLNSIQKSHRLIAHIRQNCFGSLTRVSCLPPMFQLEVWIIPALLMLCNLVRPKVERPTFID